MPLDNANTPSLTVYGSASASNITHMLYSAMSLCTDWRVMAKDQSPNHAVDWELPLNVTAQESPSIAGLLNESFESLHLPLTVTHRSGEGKDKKQYFTLHITPDATSVAQSLADIKSYLRDLLPPPLTEGKHAWHRLDDYRPHHSQITINKLHINTLTIIDELKTACIEQSVKQSAAVSPTQSFTIRIPLEKLTSDEKILDGSLNLAFNSLHGVLGSNIMQLDKRVASTSGNPKTGTPPQLVFQIRACNPHKPNEYEYDRHAAEILGKEIQDNARSIRTYMRKVLYMNKDEHMQSALTH